MRAGKGGSKQYLEEWRRETIACSPDLQSAADEAVRQLERRFDDAELTRLVKAGGVLRE